MSARSKTVFDYTELKVCPFPSSKRSKRIYRPLIPVVIFYRQKYVQFVAMIDSGADNNIFHGDVAVYLGMKLTKGSKRNISGIGGETKGYEHMVKLQVGNTRYKAPAIFSNKLPSNALAVLGNQGFFDHFHVELQYPMKIIIAGK